MDSFTRKRLVLCLLKRSVSSRGLPALLAGLLRGAARRLLRRHHHRRRPARRIARRPLHPGKRVPHLRTPPAPTHLQVQAGSHRGARRGVRRRHAKASCLGPAVGIERQPNQRLDVLVTCKKRRNLSEIDIPGDRLEIALCHSRTREYSRKYRS